MYFSCKETCKEDTSRNRVAYEIVEDLKANF